MRFKIDENLPEDVAEKLREAGWDAVSVVQQRLAGADDGRVSEACDAENRILITLDQGFSNIRAYMPRAHPGFIVYRLRSQDKRHVIEVTSRVVAALRDRPVRNELWIVEEDRIRIRSDNVTSV